MRIGMRLGPFWVSTGPRRRRPRGGRGNWKAAGIAGGAIGLLLITGIATGCANGAPAGNTSPAATITTASPADSVAAIVASTQPTVKRTTQPARTRTATATSQPPAPPAPARTTHAAPPPPPPSTKPPASKAPASCYPLTNGGNCYEPGEYCRNSDHGVHGVAGDGEAIVCEDNNGWRWEPV